MQTWQELFEKVIVPLCGLAGIAFAALGGDVPQALYPVLAGMIGYPAVRAADKARRDKNGNNS